MYHIVLYKKPPILITHDGGCLQSCSSSFNGPSGTIFKSDNCDRRMILQGASATLASTTPAGQGFGLHPEYAGARHVSLEQFSAV
jgi:hypothetical protein